MTPPLQWQGQCAHCHQTFPMEESQAHALVCEARSRADFIREVERPKAWCHDVSVVREVMSASSAGAVKKYYVGTTEQVITRPQLMALRDLINLALEESPAPVAATPVPA